MPRTAQFNDGCGGTIDPSTITMRQHGASADAIPNNANSATAAPPVSQDSEAAADSQLSGAVGPAPPTVDTSHDGVVASGIPGLGMGPELPATAHNEGGDVMVSLQRWCRSDVCGWSGGVAETDAESERERESRLLSPDRHIA